MKKFVTVLTAILFVVSAFAQDNAPQAPKQSKGERMRAEKIGYLTQKLDLTPEEAQVFWPVYNQYEAAAKDANKAVKQTRKALKPGKDQPELSDKEAKDAINAYIKALKAKDEVIATFNPKFLKVLPAQKVAKLYAAEEAFQNKMLREMYQRQARKAISGQGPKGPKGPKGPHHAPQGAPATEPVK